MPPKKSTQRRGRPGAAVNPESETDEEYELSVSTEVEMSPTTYLNSSVRPKAKPPSGVDNQG